MTGPVTETEWGVRYQHDDTMHVDNCGSSTFGLTSEELARCRADSYNAIAPETLQHVTLVKRQVTYGPWEPAEAAQAAAAQDADAEASQDDEQAEPAEHQANPF